MEDTSQKKITLKRITFVLFFLLLISISFGVKLIEFDNPYSGFNQKRQLDNLFAIESYFVEGMGLQRRTAGGDYVLYELPVYQAIITSLSQSQADILTTARIINLIFALLSIILLFRIASIWFDNRTAIYAVTFFAFAPLNLSYHRAILIDTFVIFFCLAATWLLLEYFRNKQKKWHAILFSLAGGLSVVTKPLYFFPVGVIALTNYINQCRSPFLQNLTDYIKKNGKLVISFLLVTAIMFGWVTFVASFSGVSVTGTFFHTFGIYLNTINWYVKIIFRFFFLALNPFTSILFMVGVVLIWARYREKDVIALLFLIPLYYIVFSQVNRGHEYYSLIMVPYASMIAGAGAMWLEDLLDSNNLFCKRELTLGIFCCFSSIVSVVIFLLNFLIGSPNLEQKPVQIENEIRTIIEPRQESHVYVNKRNFPLSDYVKYNRTLYLQHILNLKSEDDMRVYGDPIVTQEVMFSLRQYGVAENTLDDTFEINLEELQLKHKKKLRYVMFYRYLDTQKLWIKKSLSKYQAIYESPDWMIYDLEKK